jgi:tetratricopeptide (TPR) repeat protein
MRRFLVVILALSLTCAAVAQDFLSKAKVLLGSRDTTAALQQLQEALKAGQKPAEVNGLLGTILYARGKTTEALPYLETAVKLNDENMDALAALSQAMLDRKDVAGALTYLRKAEKISKKNPVILTVYGKALLMADSVDASIRMLTLAKEYDASSSVIYTLLGDAYLKQPVPPLAISNYQKAIELNPRDIATRTKLAKVFEKTQNYNDAVKEYDGILGIDSLNTDALLAKGKILIRAKQYSRAISPLRKFTTLDPRSVEGGVLYTRALFGTDIYAEAAKEAERTLKMDASNADVWRILAQSRVELKDNDGALKAYEELQRRNAFKPEDQSKYGTALVAAGREDEALKALLAAVATDSTNCDPYYNLGSLYMKKQDYEKAAAMFEKKIGCDPKSLGAYLNASASYMAQKNYTRARELLLKAIELKPDFLLGRLWLARYYMTVDSLDKAKENYEEVLKQCTANPEKYKKEAAEAHAQMGSYYFQTKQYERAIDSFRKALGLGNENAPLRLSWGQAVLQTLDPKGSQDDNRKKIEESTNQFRRALQLDPNSAMGHLWLAQSLVLSRVEGDNEGNKKLQEEACGEYRKVLKIDPKNEDAKKGMERISCPGAGK